MNTVTPITATGSPGASMLLPVIHHRDDATTLANAAIALGAGCPGIVLIQMEARDHLLDAVIPKVWERFPGLRIGVNRLGAGPVQSIRQNVILGVDFTWSDSCGISSSGPESVAGDIQALLEKYPEHRFFGSVAFKYQRTEPNPARAASLAFKAGFIPTTSGSATGSAPSVTKIEAMAAALPAKTLAVASGITPENVTAFIPHVRYFLVSTGISKTFHEFDDGLVNELASKIRHFPATTG